MVMEFSWVIIRVVMAKRIFGVLVKVLPIKERHCIFYNWFNRQFKALNIQNPAGGRFQPSPTGS